MDIKELENEFVGSAEVRGFKFKQLLANGYAYLYEVRMPALSDPYYEVFERRVNRVYGCVVYPKAKAFGRWAWHRFSLEEARLKYDDITKRLERKRMA